MPFQGDSADRSSPCASFERLPYAARLLSGRVDSARHALPRFYVSSCYMSSYMTPNTILHGPNGSERFSTVHE